MTKQLLIIGKPNSGKTTFLAQLHLLLDTNNSSLKLYKPVDNLTPIIDALNCLADGEEVKPTPMEMSTTIILPIQFWEQKIDLNCPDYGGEQINNIIDNREVDAKWTDSIRQSENWILFIRPSNLSANYDLSNKTINPDVLKSGNDTAEEYSISDQSSFIELLQIMLYTKGHDCHFRNADTKLTIVLTCWDEVKNNDTPKQKLIKCLPLLFNFIESNWIESKFNVIGLSALGLNLKEQGNKEKYQTEGSENFGYIIMADGSEIHDITKLISEAL
jgi:GTPase SAR1 family protein